MNTVSLKLNVSLLRLIFILGPSLLVMSSLRFVLGIEDYLSACHHNLADRIWLDRC